MKLNGVTVKIERESVIPILSKNGTFYLIARPILSYSEFDQMCPRPVPRMGGEPGKEKPLIDARDYQDKVAENGKKFHEWVIITSLIEIAGEDGERYPIEWDTVDKTDPDTFENWRSELIKQNGFAESDIHRIEYEVLRCNQMDDQMIEAAKDRFLAMERDRQS